MNDNNPQKPKNVLADLIIPVLALIFAVYYLTTITEVPWISQASAITVSALLALAIAAFFIRTAYRIKRKRETIAFEKTTTDKTVTVKRIMLLGLTIAYVYLIEPLGFTLTTICFLFLGIVLLSSLANWKNAALISLISALIGYVVFIYFFQTRFPQGVIELYIEGLLGHGA